MVYHLFQNFFGKVVKKAKMPERKPRGAEIKFPQCTCLGHHIVLLMFSMDLTKILDE